MLAVAAPCSCSWTGHIRWIRTDCPAILDPSGPPEILTTGDNWNQNFISHQCYVGAEEDGIDSRIAMDSFADVRKVIAISSWIKLRHPRAEHQYLLTILLMADSNANGQEDDELHSKFRKK
jgi:hypothetical protein